MDRTPVGPRHRRILVILGCATFFDGFDAITIAYILPALMMEWRFTSAEAGILVAAGYFGQAMGALLFGSIAGRWGRVPALAWSCILIAAGSLLCSVAPDMTVFLIARLIQGLGLGGEMPVASTYVSEIIPHRQRARLFYFYQSSFGLGILGAAILSTLLVPQFGWRCMFYMGMIPVLLLLPLWLYCAESPIWLASRGSAEKADAVMQSMEAHYTDAERNAVPVASTPLPSGIVDTSRPADLLSARYLGPTLLICSLWMCSNVISYGIGVWMPTILTSIYKVSLGNALSVSVILTGSSVAASLTLGLCARRLNRARVIALCFFLALLLLGALAWIRPESAVVFATIAVAAHILSAAAMATLYLYTPELYPTNIKALVTGIAVGSMRVASIVAPVVIGALLVGGNIASVMYFLMAAASVGGVGTLIWLTNQRLARTGPGREL